MQQTYDTTTIADNATESGVIELRGYKLAAVIIPSAWTTADLTVLVSPTKEGTYVPLYTDDGTEVKVTVGGTSRAVAFDFFATSLATCAFIKLRSGTASTPVAQADPRTLIVLLKD